MVRGGCQARPRRSRSQDRGSGKARSRGDQKSRAKPIARIDPRLRAEPDPNRGSVDIHRLNADRDHEPVCRRPALRDESARIPASDGARWRGLIPRCGTATEPAVPRGTRPSDFWLQLRRFRLSKEEFGGRCASGLPPTPTSRTGAPQCPQLQPWPHPAKSSSSGTRPSSIAFMT